MRQDGPSLFMKIENWSVQNKIFEMLMDRYQARSEASKSLYDSWISEMDYLPDD